MYKIKCLNPISEYGMNQFDLSKYEVIQNEGANAILVRSASMHEMDPDDALLAIARAGAGVNNIPIDRCSEQGIVVFNTPGANANAVKELVLAGLLLSSRKILDSIGWVNTIKGNGDAVPNMVEKGKSAFTGPEISGKKLGVIGLGAIGVLVANAATSLGMQVYGYDPYISIEAAWHLSRSVVRSRSLREIYENCDYISIHVPLTPETKGMINKQAIEIMKDDVRILNYSRADLVNDADLLAALDSEKVYAYVTDFPNDTVIGHKGVIAIPHLGASTPESEDNCAKMAADQLIDYLETGNIVNSVNMPEVNLAKSTDYRICMIHKNIPHVLAQVSSVVSDTGENIENMLNKSKKDYAYTILDVTHPVSSETLCKLSGIEGMIRIRVV